MPKQHPGRQRSPTSRSYVQPYVPPAQHPQPPQQTAGKRWEDMTPVEALAHIGTIRARLVAKQTRERAYLDRRAARGTHTPTDDVYEADQELETDLLALLDGLEQAVREDFER